jgi:hypothetical protein
MEDSEDCAVCLCAMSDAFAAQCGHRFCRACITQTLGANMRGCPLCRGPMSCYSVRSVSSGEALVRSEIASPLEGSLFIQVGTVGLASYHLSRERSFIAYRRGRVPDQWRLDNGERPPEEKDFEGARYDAATRTFWGRVVWSAVPGLSTFCGDTHWDYEMVFDEAFSQIMGGTCRMFRAGAAEPHAQLRYGHEMLYRRLRDTIVGSVYVQKFAQVGAASYHFGDAAAAAAAAQRDELRVPRDRADWWVDFSRSPDWWRRCMAPNFPDRVPFSRASYDHATRTLHGAVDLSRHPFGEETLWEYQVEFDEALHMIVGGHVTCKDAQGRVRALRSFVRFDLQVPEEEDDADPVLQYRLLQPWE